MTDPSLNKDLTSTVQNRRQKLSALFPQPILLWSGKASARNFPANRFPFRASSHFLYFAGISLPDAVIRIEPGKSTLFIDNPPPDDALWHGVSLQPEQLGAQIGADAVYPLAELAQQSQNAFTIAVQDAFTYQQQRQILQRDLSPASRLTGGDRELAKAIIQLRLIHDQGALSEIRRAIATTVEAHLAGMKATAWAKSEAEIRAAMESRILANNMTCAYTSIVTVHGEILHNDLYHHALRSQDLLLADVGAETALGWAADITRTWPVQGKFSPSQRDIYEVVLAAHDACIAKIKSDVEYRDLHLLAATVLAEGLVNLGILRGNPVSLVEQDAHSLFFPHGIGHLLGLDVHDMEDLGDLAGYESGRTRSDRFGLGYLRLDRPLRAGMVVTIEPGFYQVPAILNDPRRRDRYQQVVNWEQLAKFSDVRGIRIENDVWVTEQGAEVLSADLPTKIEDIEAICQQP
jgi:Xaa-Pro aminopeptidase